MLSKQEVREMSRDEIPLKDLPRVMDRKASNEENPKDVAASARPDITLVPQAGIIHEALAMVEGDQKYGGYNYRVAGVQVSVYIAACLRHIFRYYNGEQCDPKSRVHHLGSARACLGIILDGEAQGNLNDDRPPIQPALTKLLEEGEEVVKHLQQIYPRRTKRYRAKDHPPAR